MKRRKYKARIKGTLSGDWQERSNFQRNPLIAAMENPDILGEDAMLFPSHDLEDQEDRLDLIKSAYATFTPRQRSIYHLISNGLTYNEIGEQLKLSNFSIYKAVQRMKTKIKTV